jgi:hypothetical protein
VGESKSWEAANDFEASGEKVELEFHPKGSLGHRRLYCCSFECFLGPVGRQRK